MKIVHFLVGLTLMVLIIAGISWLLGINPIALLLGGVMLFALYSVTNLPDYRTRYRD